MPDARERLWEHTTVKESAMKLYLVIVFVGGVCSLSSAMRDKIFVLQPPDGTDKKMVVVTWSEETELGGTAFECVIFTDKRLIEEVLKESKNHEIHKPTHEEMEGLLEECTTFSLRRRRRQALESTTKSIGDIEYDEDAATTEHSGWNVIFPGTKWCGAGSIAKNNDDLGRLEDTDRCCRAHDLCDDVMASGVTKNGLTNESKFTKLSCKCDNDFYDCLSRINSVASNTIGKMYFNILARSCFTKDYPRNNKCARYMSVMKISCAEYQRDTEATPVYQWIPAKNYKKLPIPKVFKRV